MLGSKEAPQRPVIILAPKEPTVEQGNNKLEAMNKINGAMGF